MAAAHDGTRGSAHGQAGHDVAGPDGRDTRGVAMAQNQADDLDDDPRESGHYGDIMDDVEAIFDAMEASTTDPSATGGPASRRPSGGTDGPAANFAPLAAPAGEGHAPAHQGPRIPSPIVVELFTAQGCEACPPAQDMLAGLIGRPDVLVLSWHVDYWDYLGWADSFARPEFSARQKGYNLSRGARMLFTPQMIVAGETLIDNPSPAALMTAIDHERAEGDHVAITRRANGPQSEIELTPLNPLPTDIAVQLIRYIPDRVIEVGAGENLGQRLNLRNIVVSSEMLAEWDGHAPLRMTVTLGAGAAANLPDDTRHALIVQRMSGHHPGEIFATILLD